MTLTELVLNEIRAHAEALELDETAVLDSCKRSAPPQTPSVRKASDRRLGSCAAAFMSWSK